MSDTNFEVARAREADVAALAIEDNGSGIAINMYSVFR